MTRPCGSRLEDGADRGQAFTIRFDDAEITAYPGESIAAVLIASGIAASRISRTSGRRGYFCGMGLCWECLVTVNDRANQRACMQTAEAGMVVRTAAAPDHNDD